MPKLKQCSTDFLNHGLILILLTINFDAQATVQSLANQAQFSKKVSIYQHYNAKGNPVFSDTKPTTSHYQLLQYDCLNCPSSKISYPTKADMQLIIKKAAITHQLEEALIKAVIHAESHFNPLALSRKGAMGLMQLMPQTAKQLGIDNAFDIESNIFAGTAYLAKMLKRFNGNLDHALAAYNAGPSRVEQYQGIPPFSETLKYVAKVKRLLIKYRQS